MSYQNGILLWTWFCDCDVHINRSRVSAIFHSRPTPGRLRVYFAFKRCFSAVVHKPTKLNTYGQISSLFCERTKLEGRRVAARFHTPFSPGWNGNIPRKTDSQKLSITKLNRPQESLRWRLSTAETKMKCGSESKGYQIECLVFFV